MSKKKYEALVIFSAAVRDDGDVRARAIEIDAARRIARDVLPRIEDAGVHEDPDPDGGIFRDSYSGRHAEPFVLDLFHFGRLGFG